VNVAEFVHSLNIVDVVIVLFLFAMFVLGYASGAVRRLVGIASVTFSFFLAAGLVQPLGEFLAHNWVQYPREYSFMIGFLTVFGAASIALFLVIQTGYHKVELLARWPIVDELLGGIAGATQGLLILLFVIMIMDTYFVITPVVDADELPFLRDVWTALSGSQFGIQLHQAVIPTVVSLTSFLLPVSLTSLYPKGS